MARYYDQVIINTNSGKFGVVHTEGCVRMLRPTDVFDTYDEAYRHAKAFLFGQEPTDETTHH